MDATQNQALYATTHLHTPIVVSPEPPHPFVHANPLFALALLSTCQFVHQSAFQFFCESTGSFARPFVPSISPPARPPTCLSALVNLYVRSPVRPARSTFPFVCPPALSTRSVRVCSFHVCSSVRLFVCLFWRCCCSIGQWLERALQSTCDRVGVSEPAAALFLAAARRIAHCVGKIRVFSTRR